MIICDGLCWIALVNARNQNDASTRSVLGIYPSLDPGFYFPRLMTLINPSLKFTELASERHFNVLTAVDIKTRSPAPIASKIFGSS